MKFFVRKTSGGKVDPEIKINTIKQLLDFVKKNGNEVIIRTDNFNYLNTKKLTELEIYDDYRE